jgi:hypothetical protein
MGEQYYPDQTEMTRAVVERIHVENRNFLKL